MFSFWLYGWQIVTALSLAGDLRFNPLEDFLTGSGGEQASKHVRSASCPAGIVMGREKFVWCDTHLFHFFVPGEQFKLEVPVGEELPQKVWRFSLYAISALSLFLLSVLFFSLLPFL